MNDPLVCLPAEIVLRIIDYTRPREVASLTRLNKSWNGFIEKTHQEHIYSSDSKVDRPSNCRDFSFLDKDQSFAKYFDGVTSWKDVCKKQMLLAHNWTSRKPTTTESVMQIGTSPVWRFRPDFKRRFIVSTSQTGGVRVTDMDNGDLLWSLGDDDVRPYAHLEYQDGMAVWDRWGNAIEIWEADDTNRGTFQRTAILSHECETRGFQLSFDTLCVVSSDGEAFVYDMKTSPPTLRTHLDIEQEAVGHLYQSLDAIVCSIGSKGYHVHSKDSGALLGILQPNTCSNVYHIKHPRSPPEHNLHTMRQGPTQNVFPPQKPRKDRLLPLRLRSGKHPDRSNPLTLDQDEWGAGMIENNFIVGISRGGRLYICSDWQGALTSPEQAAASSAIIECESDGSTFDLGGWLSIKNHRVLLEVGDRIYIFTLNQEGPLPGTGEHAQPIWATSTSSAPQLKVPVSFMAIYDDCLMSTYTVSSPHPFAFVLIA